MNGKGSNRLAVAALVLLSFLWGYNWVVMKQVIRYVDPFDFSALRALLGALSLFVALVALRRPLKVTAFREVALLGLLQTATFTGLVQLALVFGGAGKTAVLVYTMPFWLAPLSYLALGERVSPAHWRSIGLAAVGLVLILDPGALHGSLRGSLLALAAGLAWAVATIVAKRLRQRHAIDLLAMTAWQMLLGALPLCLVALTLPSRPIDATPYFIGALAYNAVPATALAWLLWLYVLNHLPASVAGLSALGIPLIGVLAGWLELGERPSGTELSGMLLIGAALALLSLSALRQRGLRRP